MRTRNTLRTIWYGMIARCHNPNHASFKRYGARGIVVCARWRDSFDAFAADVGERPSPSHSLDRWPNNDGNYEPNNVRWATPREQADNSCWPIRIHVDGKERLLIDVAREHGLPSTTVWCRIFNYGWDPLRAATTRAHSTQERVVQFRGDQWTVTDLCREHGVSSSMVFYRLDRGWSVEDAITKPSRRVVEAGNKASRARKGA